MHGPNSISRSNSFKTESSFEKSEVWSCETSASTNLIFRNHVTKSYKITSHEFIFTANKNNLKSPYHFSLSLKVLFAVLFCRSACLSWLLGRYQWSVWTPCFIREKYGTQLKTKWGVLGRHSDWPVKSQNAKTKRREIKESVDCNLKYGILEFRCLSN